ncbi:hypothetical protein L226DRAFT_525857 [Lentinus tigrinus ALCF2SS1-7]|uniref:Uncharacterized protein n=1 Tax=Lentinus tigrinus ALCF2SS1-6 TaxID=1328759 RepID=A0A5C2RQV7_9APHY|nr:hypothetical protein L227DRAFT_616636 [Lentinus tigrinus ALCF2SS1-6]RPD70560.1 hypothetical protein L226DRAFT_525857 [Lentinus tigrinus ALCF2SS1-7]
MAQLNGFSLQYAGPSAPPTIAFSYSTGSLSRSGSLTSSTPLKRKRSELAMTVTGVTVAVATSNVPLSPIILPGIHPDEPYVAPPSPVPTEIVDDTPEKSGEELVEAAKAAGVKVRDFAYEPVPKPPRDPRAPEFWTKALENLILHDRYIRRHPTEAESIRLPGKILYRLLALGWVTQEEAEHNWREGDWKAVAEYTSRPNGPYPVCIPKSHKKPTAAYRALLRTESFLTLEDDVPEECIYVPPDEPGMDNGLQRPPISVFGLPLAAHPTPVLDSSHHPATGHRDAAGNDVHVDKRRRVSAPGTPSATPSAGPSRTLSRTLSRSASSQCLSASRSGTPVYEAPAPPVRARNALRRTETMASIPVR